MVRGALANGVFVKKRDDCSLFVLAAALLAAAAPASAQIAPGLSGRSTTDVIEDNGEFWRTLVAFGNCYADNNAERAFTLIATEPGSSEERQVFRGLFTRGTNSCLYGTTLVNVTRAMVRGAIAEGLYRRGTAIPIHLVQPPLEAGVPARTLSEAARCYTAAHRSEVEALVAGSRAGSRQELEQLNAMADDFFACLPESGRDRSFDPTLIRYRLVEALLRRPPASAVPSN